jgi:hypothetical protein
VGSYKGSSEDALYKGAEKEEIAFAIALENGIKRKWHFEYDRAEDVLGYASKLVTDVTHTASKSCKIL